MTTLACLDLSAHTLADADISDYYNLELKEDLKSEIRREVADPEYSRLMVFLSLGAGTAKLQLSADLDLKPDESLGRLNISVNASGCGMDADQKIARATADYIRARCIGFSKLYCTVWLAQREALENRYGPDPLAEFIARTYPHVAPALLVRDPPKEDALRGERIVYRIHDLSFDWIYTVTVDVTGKPLHAVEQRQLNRK